ncbi:class I adenylate-forming enzyme family protein [Ekhidna sp.]|uniref:class I adenylate-forming enzyme family protein n=1 Tax=Ekhidna sp. TaxID=2608089 RepID=UPI003297E436
MEDLFNDYQYKKAKIDSDLGNGNENYGHLVSSDGSNTFPFIDNLFFPHLENSHHPDFFSSFFKRASEYSSFLQQKSQRPFVDIYAAFQPFNEAFKALYPFLDLANKVLQPNSVILNLWDRSGWTTALLSSIFPECRIITVWEGNKDVLGYHGYYYWFGHEPLVSILFCEIDQKLPLSDHSVDMVVGMDAFHRYDQVRLLDEMDRLGKKHASFVFPHVHLTNSEPEPYFDRGCIQRHGLEYQSTFEGLGEREGYVFSEPELFKFQVGDGKKFTIKSDPETADYNSLLAILSAKWKDHKSLSKLSFNSKDVLEKGSVRVLMNPLYKINDSFKRATLDTENSEVERLLERHPVYLNQVCRLVELSLRQSMILLLASQGNTLGEMSVKIGIDLEKINAECEELESKGLIHCVPIKDRFFEFQTFMGSQKILWRPMNLSTMWSHYSSINSDSTYLIDSDGNELTYGEADEVITQVKKKLQAINGLAPGDKIAILSSLNIENIVLFWAAASCGLTVIPLTTSMADVNVERVVGSGVKLFFTDQDEYMRVKKIFDGELIVFDSENSDNEDCTNFSEWIYDGANAEVINVELPEDHTAVILHTSGSTGTPKGVALSHSNLISSGRTMNHHFGWKSEDAFLALGGMEYMSGLRNSTTCPLLSGTSILVPSKLHVSNVFAILDLITAYRPTIIAANPALFNLISKVDGKVNLSSLRLVLCTGNYLSNHLRSLFYEKHGIVIHNYYGLTETCGICVAQDPKRSDLSDNNIGISVESLVRVIDCTQEGVGLLEVWSDNLAEGIKSKNTSEIDWFTTGDQAFIDKEGKVHLVGRAKEVLKTKGEQIIYLSGIEEILRSLSEIDEVVAHATNQNEAEHLVLFLKFNRADDVVDIKHKIREAIKASLTTEKIPLVLYAMEDISFVNGKINKEKLLDEAFKNREPL